MSHPDAVMEAVGQAVVVAVDQDVVVAVDEAVVVAVDEAVMDDRSGVRDEAVMHDGSGVDDRSGVVDVVLLGDDVGGGDGQSGDVLHVGNNLVGEVGLHAVDAGHVKAVAIAVDIGIAVDVTVDVGITVVEANVAGHGATSAAESNNEVLHVWFGKSW